MLPPSLRRGAVGACLAFGLPAAAGAQVLPATRSGTGVVLSKATMLPLPGATITSRLRGVSVLADAEGRFVMPAAAGDTLVISHVGYTSLRLPVPAESAGGIWSLMAALPEHRAQLPGVLVRERITAAEFRRAFLQAPVKPDSVRAAMQGLSPEDLKVLRGSTPPSGSESVGRVMAAQANAAVHRGQIATMPGLNLFHWLKRRKKK